MKSSRSQRGFTLLEVMVVVVIIATMAAVSMLALNQAGNRRYLSQADNLLAWFQQLSELAMIEGVAYGLVLENQTLHSMVFYRQRWHPAANPEPFQLFNNAVINLPENAAFNIDNSATRNNNIVLPDIVMMPGGFMEPLVTINLTYVDEEPTFDYYWDDLASTLIMEEGLESNTR